MAEKKYTFAGMHKGNSEGVAVGYLEGWVTKEVESRFANDKPVANTNLALNNATKKLAYALGVKSLAENGDGTLFVRVAGWEQVAERIQKVVSKGQLIGVSGVLKLEEYEGREQLNFTIYDFKIVYSAKNSTGTSNNSSNASNTSNSNGYKDDPFANDGKPIDISDDDLPF